MMNEVTFAQAVCEALREEMSRDESVLILGEDIALHGGAFGATKGLYAEFGGERVRNTPISELSLVGCAVGAALNGCRPVVELMYMDFVTLAMDQIVNQAAKMRYMFGGEVNVPLVVRTQVGGARAGAAQHSQSLESWFCHVPGLKVAMPSTPYDAKGLLKTAIRDNNPIIFIEHKMLYSSKGLVPEEEYALPFGQACVRREGSDVTVIATGHMVRKALDAAEILCSENIDVELIDPRTLVPLDEETILHSVRKTGRVAVVHESCERGGIGGEIAAIIVEKAFDYLDAPIVRVAGANAPMPYSLTLENLAVPGVDDVVRAVRQMCN